MLSPRNRKVFSIRISFVFLDEKMSHMMKLNKDDEHKFLWQIPTLTLIYFFDVNENWATSFQLASSVLRSRSLSAKTIRLKISVLIVCPFERLREFHEKLPKTNKNKLRFSRSFAYNLIFLQDFQLENKIMALWLDKHRPKKLNKLDYHKKQAEHLEKLVKSGDFPHLLVHGNF